MLNLQVTLSQFQCRKRQFQQSNQQNIIFRFGSIKIDIKISQNYQNFIGGKKVIIDLSTQQLQQMFSTFSIGMFIENQNGKFFSILSLQKLNCQDIISGQEIYFYNDFEEIIYSTNFSIKFTSFKNPKMPNKQKIQNHKTFKQHFTKPAVPKNDGKAQTLSSFLYGTVQKQKAKPKTNFNTQRSFKKTYNQQNFKQSNISGWKKKNTKQNDFYTSNNVNRYSNQPIKQPLVRLSQQYQDIQDQNPPVMQFTNTLQNPLEGINTLKNQLNQLNLTAPHMIKFQSPFQTKTNFKKDKNSTVNKIKDKMQNYSNQILKTGFTYKGQTGLSYNNAKEQNQKKQIAVNRQQLKKRARQQMQVYKGQNNVKIPIVKDGKCQFIQIAQLSEQQIKNFAKRQNQLYEQEQRKKQVQRQLLNKQKQNELLKNQIKQKQRLLLKKEEQARKQKLQLLQTKKNMQSQLNKKNQQKYNSSNINSYEEESQIEINHIDQQEENNDDSENQIDQENYYSSDFEQISMASGLKKSKLSIKQKKKGSQSQSYNESYDPDFQSYSQSLLGSHQKLSMSQISQSLRDSFHKKR